MRTACEVSADAANVFQRLRDDKSLKEEKAPEAPATSAAPVQLDRTVPVNVYNATGLDGRSATIASVIEGLGYSNVTPGTSASPTNSPRCSTRPVTRRRRRKLPRS